MIRKDYAKRLKRFPEYASIKDDFLVIPERKDIVPPASVGLPLDSTARLIFAPDPVTGCPRSDLAVMLSKDARPEVAQFIQQSFLRSQPSHVSADDADTALEFAKSRGESIVSYGNRLREIVKSYRDKALAEKNSEK